MGFNTETVTKVADGLTDLTQDGVPINVNVDQQTISAFGPYMIALGVVTGFAAAFFNYLFRKIFN